MLQRKQRVHRRGAEDAEITQRKAINSLRPLCVLCVSAVNQLVESLRAASLFKQGDYLFVFLLFCITGSGLVAHGFYFRVGPRVE